MKKKLDTISMINELRGNSVFFPSKNEAKKQDASPLPSPSEHQTTNPYVDNQARKQESFHASKHASVIASIEEIIETIRKVVKMPAKEEVLYVRVTRARLCTIWGKELGMETS